MAAACLTAHMPPVSVARLPCAMVVGLLGRTRSGLPSVGTTYWLSVLAM